MAAELPLAPLKRVAKKHGAKRVSDRAVEELRDILEEEADKLARDAIVAAKHAGRVTIKDRDVKMIYRK